MRTLREDRTWTSELLDAPPSPESVEEDRRCRGRDAGREPRVRHRLHRGCRPARTRQDAREDPESFPSSGGAAGTGRITIDSSAAESVLPVGMLPGEETVEDESKRKGVRYVAANGGKMENHGEKRVRFRRNGSEAVNSITFQVTGVSKPLASVGRILDKGSYIWNEATGEKVPIVEDGTLEFLELAGFSRQGP